MQYYVSWVDSDPIFHEVLPTVGVLVSPPNVAVRWQPERWPSQPTALLVDSGAYQLRGQTSNESPAAILARQLEIARLCTGHVGLCHLDIALTSRSLAELDTSVARSLQNAQTLMDLLAETRLPPNVVPIGVIQGYSVESVFYAAQLLADMGYTHFALGSLAALVARNRDQLIRRVEAALEAVGSALHILGVSSLAALEQIAALGVQSVDSSAPMHEAYRGGILYSEPFRRYKLSNPYFREWRRTYAFAELLEAPLPCDCPICRVDPERLMEARGRQAVHGRAIHNCYHLMRAVEGVAPSDAWRSNS